MEKQTRYFLVSLALIISVLCCGLFVIAAITTWSAVSQPVLVAQPTNQFPTSRPSTPSVPTAIASARLEKLGSQGLNDFLVASQDLIENPKELEARLREFCDKYRGDFCYTFVWGNKVDAALSLPMTNSQLNTQVAQYSRNKTTGYDCFFMLKNGEVIEETRSTGCSP